MTKTLLVTENTDFDPKKIDWHIHPGEPGKADGIFLRCYNHVHVGFDTAVDERNNFLLRETVVISKAAGGFYLGAKLLHTFFKALGNCDRADCADLGFLNITERTGLTGFNMLEIAGTVFALNDLCSAVVEADTLDELIIRLTIALGNEDVGGTLQVFRRLAQSAARE